MIHKKVICGGGFYVGYMLLGATIGAAIGYLIPPGSFFWFILGAAGGYLARPYLDQRRY